MSHGETIASLIRAKHGSFTHAQVVELIGIKDETLQNWAKRKIINPVISSPGRQGRREYSGRDLAGMVIGVKLVELGIPPAQALPIGRRCIADLTMSKYWIIPGERDRWTISDEVADLYQILIGHLSAEGPLRLELIRPSQLSEIDLALSPSIVLPFGHLMLDISERVAKLGV